MYNNTMFLKKQVLCRPQDHQFIVQIIDIWYLDATFNFFFSVTFYIYATFTSRFIIYTSFVHHVKPL